MINPNWARWVKASVYQHFASLNRTDPLALKIKTNGVVGMIPIHFEGDARNRDNREGQDTASYLEVKIDGPSIRELTDGEFRLEVMIHQVILAVEDLDDIYLYDRIKGLAMAMHEDFLLYRLGEGADDDGLAFGCLKFRQDSKCPLETHDYGRVDQGTRMYQGTITGCYRADITE